MGIREDIAAHERSSREAIEAFRKLSEADRLRALSDLIDSARMFVAVGVRDEHPEWTPQQVAAETARRVAHANG